MSKVIIEFPNDELRDLFCGWFSDGGGEYSFMESAEIHGGYKVDVLYNRCFPAWGWKPEDGDPIIDIEKQ